MRSLLTAGLAAGLLMSTPAWSADAEYSASTVLATVNGTDITLGNLIAMRDRLPEQYRDLPDETLMTGILDQLVDQTLLSQQVSQSPESDPLEVKLHLENERRAALAAQAIDARVGQPIDEAKVKEAYDAATADFVPQQEYSASHILVASEEEATSLESELESGADFAALAKEHSTDGSAANGGSLGWFGSGQMVPEFEQAVAGMEVGAVSDPVKTQFGWHVIKLDDKRMSSPPPIDQVRPQLENQIRQQALKGEIEALRADAKIERPETDLPPEAIRDKSLLEE